MLLPAVLRWAFTNADGIVVLKGPMAQRSQGNAYQEPCCMTHDLCVTKTVTVSWVISGTPHPNRPPDPSFMPVDSSSNLKTSCAAASGAVDALLTRGPEGNQQKPRGALELGKAQSSGWIGKVIFDLQELHVFLASVERSEVNPRLGCPFVGRGAFHQGVLAGCHFDLNEGGGDGSLQCVGCSLELELQVSCL